MGSLRTNRATNTETLTAADRPAGLPDVDAQGNPNWLAEGETITYYTRLPYRVSVRIADEAYRPEQKDNGGGDFQARLAYGSFQYIKLQGGIQSWSLRDERDRVVPWKPENALTLLDYLPDAVREALMERIGATDDAEKEAAAKDEAEGGPGKG